MRGGGCYKYQTKTQAGDFPIFPSNVRGILTLYFQLIIFGDGFESILQVKYTSWPSSMLSRSSGSPSLIETLGPSENNFPLKEMSVTTWEMF